MTNKKLGNFIATYEKYYFADLSPEDKRYGVKALGVKINHPASPESEDTIIEELKAGKQSLATIEWKMGVNAKDDCLKTHYHSFDIKKVEQFINDAAGLAERNTYDFNDENDIRKAYDAVLSAVSDTGLTGYGSVYIISSLFFLSKGQVPIYDYYAHVGVKALLDDICPQDVYVGEAPPKEQHSRGDKSKRSAVNLLMEYRRQLKALVSDTVYFENDGMYISRSLDRALWGYGHATKRWEKEKGK